MKTRIAAALSSAVWGLIALTSISLVSAAQIGFEPAGGFAADSDMAIQSDWKQSVPRVAKISAAEAQSGAQSLELTASASDVAAIWRPAVFAYFQGVAYVDFAIRPSMDPSASPAYSVDALGARLGFVPANGGGTVVAVNPGTAAATETHANIPVGEANLAAEWIRVTIRADLPAKTWDLFLDGRPVLVDQALSGEGEAGAISFYASPGGGTFIDDLAASRENPLFFDEDNDAIPDAFEIAHGSNPRLNDRSARVTRNGPSNLEAFLQAFSAEGARAGVAGARAWYVDQDRGRDTFTGRQSYSVGGDGPKQTFAAVVAEASPKDIVVFLPAASAYDVDLTVAVQKSLTLRPLTTATLK